MSTPPEHNRYSWPNHFSPVMEETAVTEKLYFERRTVYVTLSKLHEFALLEEIKDDNKMLNIALLSAVDWGVFREPPPEHVIHWIVKDTDYRDQFYPDTPLFQLIVWLSPNEDLVNRAALNESTWVREYTKFHLEQFVSRFGAPDATK